jgi:hypothetical protein
MSRPLLEVADLVRSAGTAFIERNRAWIRWTHIKVLLAIARCRTAALGGHTSMSASVAGIVPPSRTTVAAIAIARSVRRAPANAGSKPGAVNFCPRPMFMSSSLCHHN